MSGWDAKVANLSIIKEKIDSTDGPSSVVWTRVVLPYIGYIGICGAKGKGFLAVFGLK